jgi:hypothetical protein
MKTINCPASPLTASELSYVNSNKDFKWLKKVQSHESFIKKLKFASVTRRRAYLTNASKDELNFMCECIRKACTGKIRPQQPQKKKLKSLQPIERVASDRKNQVSFYFYIVF